MVASVGTILTAPGDGDMKVYLDAARSAAGGPSTAPRPSAHGKEPIDIPPALSAATVAYRLMREAKGAGLAVAGHGPSEGATDDRLAPGTRTTTIPWLTIYLRSPPSVCGPTSAKLAKEKGGSGSTPCSTERLALHCGRMSAERGTARQRFSP